MRRYRVVLACLFGLLLAAQDGGARRGVEIHNGQKAGEFRVENATGSPVRLAVAAGLERKTPGTSNWVNMGIAYRLIEACGGTVEATVTIKAKGVLVPVAWTGYDCEAQCPTSCRMNGWAGVGTYRLVVKSANGAHRWTGPEFQLGREP